MDSSSPQSRCRAGGRASTRSAGMPLLQAEIQRPRNAGAPALLREEPEPARIVTGLLSRYFGLGLVLAAWRATPSLCRRHPGGRAATAFPVPTRQPLKRHDRFLDLCAFGA